MATDDYICDDCTKTFDTPELLEEHQQEFAHGEYAGDDG